MCEHNIVKYICKYCNGNSICIHNKVKSKCIQCGGSNYCLHNIIKSSCIKCKGGSICIHNKRKIVCKECHGSSICIHNKEKRYCIDCGGSAICIHNKLKTQCKICGGASLCKISMCESKRLSKYDGHCAFCYYHIFPDKPNSRNYKTKERSVVEFIIDTFPEYTWITDKTINDGCSNRRPDLLLDLGYQVIIVEIDETQHKSYEEICNNRRTMEISKDLDHRPIIFIRFNPDSYKDKNNKLINSCWKINKDGLCSLNNKNEWSIRLNKLKSTIEMWCNENNKSEKTIKIEYLFYDECSEQSDSDSNNEININNLKN